MSRGDLPSPVLGLDHQNNFDKIVELYFVLYVERIRRDAIAMVELAYMERDNFTAYFLFDNALNTELFKSLRDALLNIAVGW